MLTDIQIAQQASLLPITDVAERIGILPEELYLYGPYKAKVTEALFERVKDNRDGKLVLVTAINPTPAGEGKTTTTVGLGESLAKIGVNSIIALREPSLGPVMGIKGGAAGGGYAQVVPMEDINLHFTGDMHAITAANNLLCAMLDNHIHQGNALGIDTRRIVIRRCMDMNDRALRQIVVGMGGRANGFVREDGFMITVASEVMAILCLAEDMEDLKRRLGRIIVGYDMSGRAVTAHDLEAEGAMALLLRDALQPNLVQTLENTPCLMHGGPFANIAHGCNSVRATKLAMKLADVVVTEAGFGADLGAEKFFDIKCRLAGIQPHMCVLVATVRAIKYNGGVDKNDLGKSDVDAVSRGLPNLEKHVENLRKFGVPVMVVLNVFDTDTDEETAVISARCMQLHVPCVFSHVFEKGGMGGIFVAKAVRDMLCRQASSFRPIYELDRPITEKVETLVREIYGGDGVVYTEKAKRQIADLQEQGFGGLPVCMAKTQYSLSDNPKLLGRPKGFTITVSEVRVSAGAGFVVVQTGDILTMPGLPKQPAACNIDIKEDGEIVGLF